MDDRDLLESIADSCRDADYRLSNIEDMLRSLRQSIEFYNDNGIDAVPKQFRIEEAKRRRERGESPWDNPYHTPPESIEDK